MGDPHRHYWPDDPRFDSHPDEAQFLLDVTPGADDGLFRPLQSRSDLDRCEVCGKPAYAAVVCAACGDEEVAA